MTTLRFKQHRPLGQAPIDHVEELQREKAAIPAMLDKSLKPKTPSVRLNTQPSQRATFGGNLAREKTVTRQIDDYSVFERANGTTWGVCGLKLGPDILTFPNREDATARGHALARESRVSLWYEPTSHLRDGILVASFRDDTVR